MYDLDKDIKDIDKSRNTLLKSLERKRKAYEKDINKKKKYEEDQLYKLKEKIKSEKFKKLYKSNNKEIKNVSNIIRESNLEVSQSIDVLKGLNKVCSDEIKKYDSEKNKLIKKFISKGEKSSLLCNDIDKLAEYIEDLF